MTNDPTDRPIDRPIKTEILFLWRPEVDGGQIIETTAQPERVAMRLEYIELPGGWDGWQLEGIDIGSLSYLVTNPDLRRLDLPPVSPVLRVTIRVRNESAERQQFPGARIIGTAVL